MKYLLIFLLIANNALAFDHSHKTFTTFLKKNVKFKGVQSLVKYENIKKDSKELDSYLGTLSSIKKEDFNKFSEKQKLAFYINAYNAFTIKLIVNHYPVESIKDIGSIFTNAWKKTFFKLFNENFHLDKIEHDIIRKQFDEPRIHFALNCASIGCPSLVDEAFTADKMEEMLTKAAKHFITNKDKNFYKKSDNSFHASSIFKWYGDDFKKRHGNFQKYISSVIGINIEKSNIEYIDYNWKLNDYK